MSAGQFVRRLSGIAAIVSSLLLASWTAEAQAQTRPAPPRSSPQQSPAAQPDEHPPYEPQLLRLAQIIGALVYLRDLCGDNDGDKWRAKMAELLAGEASSESERQRLAGAYNQGFRGYSLTYRSCTANAKLVIARYIEEGEQLAHDVESSYGGG
jgi:uncharacterized protein (TIGR02301 family)